MNEIEILGLATEVLLDGFDVSALKMKCLLGPESVPDLQFGVAGEAVQVVEDRSDIRLQERVSGKWKTDFTSDDVFPLAPS
jgi:hypothetical protein